MIKIHNSWLNFPHKIARSIELSSQVSGVIRSQVGHMVLDTIIEPIQHGISVAIRHALKEKK